MAAEAGWSEFERLRALRGTGLLSSPAPPELEDVCRRAKEHFGVAVALVTLIDDHRLIAKARAGTDLAEVPRTGQFCDRTICSDDVFVVPDALPSRRRVRNLSR